MSVYKYLKPERIDILEKSVIRFTQPAYFNDPFEMKPFVHSLASDKLLKNLSTTLINNRTQLKNLIENAIDMRIAEASVQELVRGLKLDLVQYYIWAYPQSSVQNILDIVNKRFPEFLKDASIDKDAVKKFYTDTIRKLLEANPQIYKNLTQYLSAHIIDMFNLMHPGVVTQLQEFFTYQIGVLTLSKTPPIGNKKDGKNLVMWAHYTDSHQGFVLEFDETHHFFDQKVNEHDMMRHLHTVRYSMKRPNIILFDTDTGELDNEQLTNHFMINFFYTKSVAWKYEQEERMLLPLEEGEKQLNTKEDVYLFAFPAECLKGVFLGYRIQPENRQRIFEMVKNGSRYTHVKLYETSIDEKEFLLNVTLIK